MKLKISVIFFLFIGLCCKAQSVFPADESKLNYTEVMFEYPQFPGADNYLLHIKECDQNNNCKLVFDTLHLTQAVRISDCFTFGKSYRWYYEAIKGKAVLYKSGEQAFSILNDLLVDSTRQRIVIKKYQKNKTSAGIIFTDGLKTAIKFDGTPVWFMKNITPEILVRDLEITPAGTITYINQWDGQETNLIGEVLWQTPQIEGTAREKKEIYHHEFTRLKSGNYIAAAKILVKPTELPGDATPLQHDGDKDYLSDIIAEFNPSGELIWSFKVLPELKKQLNIFPTKKAKNARLLGHLNGLAVNEKDSFVYASFKNFNSVFKIDQRTNKILHMYGNKKIVFNDSTLKSPLFAQQHSPVFLKNGNLLIYDNNYKENGSGIVELTTGKLSAKIPEKVWEYRIKNAGFEKYYAPNMGSVQELPNGTILCTMGSENNVFIVNRKKEILWHANTQTNSLFPKDTGWEVLNSYRVKWCSSLYPCYYTLQYAREYFTIDVKQDFLFQINNEGTEDDTYEIEILQPAKAIIIKKEPVKVDGETSKEINVKAEDIKGFDPQHEMVVFVRSATSQTAKELHYYFKK